MIRIFVLLFGVVVVMATAATSKKHYYKYVSVGEEGLNIKKDPMLKKKFLIPAKQCSGELNYPRDFHCTGNGGSLKDADNVRVRVEDDGGPPKIIFSNDRRRITIYRVACEKRALVFVHTVCA